MAPHSEKTSRTHLEGPFHSDSDGSNKNNIDLEQNTDIVPGVDPKPRTKSKKKSSENSTKRRSRSKSKQRASTKVPKETDDYGDQKIDEKTKPRSKSKSKRKSTSKATKTSSDNSGVLPRNNEEQPKEQSVPKSDSKPKKVSKPKKKKEEEKSSVKEVVQPEPVNTLERFLQDSFTTLSDDNDCYAKTKKTTTKKTKAKTKKRETTKRSSTKSPKRRSNSKSNRSSRSSAKSPADIPQSVSERDKKKPKKSKKRSSTRSPTPNSRPSENDDSSMASLEPTAEDRVALVRNDKPKRTSKLRYSDSNIVFDKRDITGKSEVSLTLNFSDSDSTINHDPKPLTVRASEDQEKRRSTFASTRKQSNFRISNNPESWDRIETFFYNHGMEIALGVLFLCLNVLAAAHGAYQFTEAGGFTTDSAILRITLPIARAGGRLVTVNCAILLLTACKYLWTLVRTYITPVVPVGFPIDHIMPKYHRIVALTIIVSGCIIHTLPQIVNYATKAITFDHKGIRFWTFGDGFATKQLLITGTLLTIIFSTFYLTTLQAFRRTTAGFRWFWFFHMGGIATAYPLLLLHGTCKGHPVFLYAALVPLILYLFDVVMRRSKAVTAKVVKWRVHDDEGQEITELVIECPPHFTYTPGQYAELKFAPISRSEWHPFTIASAPDEEDEKKDDEKLIIWERNSNSEDEDAAEDEPSLQSKPKRVTFYIKNVGRWTSAFYEYAAAYDLTKSRRPPEIQIRGPHGAPAMNYFEYKHILVVGSGVGVTPLLSIWNYLFAKGKHLHLNDVESGRTARDDTLCAGTNLHDSIVSFCSRADSNVSSVRNLHNSNLFRSTKGLGVPSLDTFNDEFSDYVNYEADTLKSPLRQRCLSLESILESMTVSMSLFIFFLLGETITIVMQLLGAIVSANMIAATLSSIALLVHGTTAIVSSIAVGLSRYIKLFRCWVECSILLVDSFALWISVKTLLVAAHGEKSTTDSSYLVFFGMVVFLQALRIFHIFYITLKPTSNESAKNPNSSNSDTPHSSRRRSSIQINRTSIVSSNGNTGAPEIYSIEGIIINRMFSNMRFAARNLLPPMLEQEKGTDIFSMTFFGTREKPKTVAPKGDDNQEDNDDDQHSECGLITDMMGSVIQGLDIRSNLIKQRQSLQESAPQCTPVRDTSNHSRTGSDRFFHPGRPDWNTIFLRALSRAHATNPKGESVGVFFCGSPAIAKDLQVQAAKVTAQHQYAIRHFKGRSCKCKIIVHSENF